MVMTGSTTGVNFLLQLPAKGSDVGTRYCWLFCWATSPPRFGEGEQNLAKSPSHACVETRAIHFRPGMVCGRKTVMMMMMISNRTKKTIIWQHSDLKQVFCFTLVNNIAIDNLLYWDSFTRPHHEYYGKGNKWSAITSLVR